MNPEPPERIAINVDFMKPCEARHMNEFAFEPDAILAKLIWKMQGTCAYLIRVARLFTNMDRLKGAHFEPGLDSLRKHARCRANT
jgi:hypothetical protein